MKASGKFCLSNPVFTNPDNYRGGGREAEKEEVEKRRMWEEKARKGKRQERGENSAECKNAGSEVSPIGLKYSRQLSCICG